MERSARLVTAAWIHSLGNVLKPGLIMSLDVVIAELEQQHLAEARLALNTYMRILRL